MKTLLIIFIFTTMSLHSAFSSTSFLSPVQNSDVTSNFRVNPSSTIMQVETSIFTHPHNSQIMVGTAITTVNPTGTSTGFYKTTNGGLNWSGTDAIKDSLNNILNTTGDPTIIIDGHGNYILPYIKGFHEGSFLRFRVEVTYSTNNGAFWSTPVILPGNELHADKVVSATDLDSGSSFFGRSYVAYVSSGNIYTSYTTNHGVTWSDLENIGSGSIPYLAVGSSGVLYAAWLGGGIRFSKSTDGGSTWTTPTDIPVQTIPKFTINYAILNGIPALAVDNSGGPRDGWLYIVLNGARNDDYDLVLYKSTNGGNNWVKSYVNQSTENLLNYQYFPMINVDDSGGVNIVYCDTRNTPANDSSQIYLSRSLDGGKTFSDILVSDHKFLIDIPELSFPAQWDPKLGIHVT